MKGDVWPVISRSLESDPRIAAAWLSGSHGRGTADDLSDIDIWLAVEDDAIGPIIDNPLAFVHAIAPTIMHIQAPSIAPPGGVYLLTWIPEGEGFGQVDWYWTPASAARRPQDTHLLFERRPVPVEPAEALDAGEVERRIDGFVRDALLQIANAWKYARRDDLWRTVDAIKNAHFCLNSLEHLVEYRQVPVWGRFDMDRMPSFIPVSLDDQRETLRQLLATLQSLITHAGRRAPFADAVSALSATLVS